MDKYIVVRSSEYKEGEPFKWGLIDKFGKIKEAKKELLQQSMYCTDGSFNNRNGRMYNPFSKKYLCTNRDTIFNYKGRIYAILNNKERIFYFGGKLKDSLINSKLTKDDKLHEKY